MKKLLSLLSVLTISGAAVPTTIAASPYQKDEIKLESNNINKEKILNEQIIFLQESDLENLIRNKRRLNEWEIAGITLAGTIIGGVLTGGIGFAVAGVSGASAATAATVGGFVATTVGLPLGAKAGEDFARNN